MRAELVVYVRVLGLSPQMKIEIADRRRKRIRIEDGETLPAWILNLEAIGKTVGAIHCRFEDASLMHPRHRDSRAVFEKDLDRICIGTIRAHHGFRAVRMRAEKRMRIRMFEGEQPVNLITQLWCWMLQVRRFVVSVFILRLLKPISHTVFLAIDSGR